MPNKNHFKAVIFDLDGTLINSLADISDSMNKTLSHMGFPTHSVENYKYFVGNGIKNLVIKSLPEEKRTDKVIEPCFQIMMEEYKNTPINKTVIYEGISELLNALSEEKIKISILSNKADILTQEVCKILLNSWSFEIILGATDKFPVKPSPESAIFIGTKMGVPFSEILYVGDTSTDMQTATAAGFFAVGAAWGFRTKEELLHFGAKHIIEKPMDLMTLINKKDF